MIHTSSNPFLLTPDLRKKLDKFYTILSLYPQAFVEFGDEVFHDAVALVGCAMKDLVDDLSTSALALAPAVDVAAAAPEGGVDDHGGCVAAGYCTDGSAGRDDFDTPHSVSHHCFPCYCLLFHISRRVLIKRYQISQSI